jgi:hypothetical protein
MSTAEVAKLAGLLARRLDAVHPAMLPLVVLLLVAASLAAVPLTATGGVLILIRRSLNGAVHYQPRKRVKS